MIEKWYAFRWWLAGKIVGFNLELEIAESYEAGRKFGIAQPYFDGFRRI